MKQPFLPGTEKFKFSEQSGSSRQRLSTWSTTELRRSDSKRRAVLPITSLKTSRVLSSAPSRVPSCPDLESQPRRWSKASLEGVPPHRENIEFDWKNIRAHPSRLSSSSSCSSSGDVWVLRKDDEPSRIELLNDKLIEALPTKPTNDVRVA